MVMSYTDQCSIFPACPVQNPLKNGVATKIFKLEIILENPFYLNNKLIFKLWKTKEKVWESVVRGEGVRHPITLVPENGHPWINCFKIIRP